MGDRNYWIYVLASGKNGTVYIGVTNSLERRTWQHKRGRNDGFTARYHVDRLVYFEAFSSIENAIAREKQLKGGSRAKKLALISQSNPAWQDLSDGWFDEMDGVVGVGAKRAVVT